VTSCVLQSASSLSLPCHPPQLQPVPPHTSASGQSSALYADFATEFDLRYVAADCAEFSDDGGSRQWLASLAFGALAPCSLLQASVPPSGLTKPLQGLACACEAQ